MVGKLKIKLGDTIFTEEEYNEVIEAVRRINPVFAFEIEGQTIFMNADDEDGEQDE